jgi:hypothetical protein
VLDFARVFLFVTATVTVGISSSLCRLHRVLLFNLVIIVVHFVSEITSFIVFIFSLMKPSPQQLCCKLKSPNQFQCVLKTIFHIIHFVVSCILLCVIRQAFW